VFQLVEHEELMALLDKVFLYLFILCCSINRSR